MRRVFTVSTDNTARIWDTEADKQTGEPLKGDVLVTSAMFSSDGQRLVTVSQDHIARVWDASTGTEMFGLSHDGKVNMATFNLNGTRILTASDDRTARVWDATGKKLATLVPQ
jgi:WD40 repeat protein